MSAVTPDDIVWHTYPAIIGHSHIHELYVQGGYCGAVEEYLDHTCTIYTCIGTMLGPDRTTLGPAKAKKMLLCSIGISLDV